MVTNSMMYIESEENNVESGEKVASWQVSDGKNHQNNMSFDEPLIDKDLVDREPFDPLAIIKKELPFHDENISEFVNDNMHEEVEYQRIDLKMTICPSFSMLNSRLAIY